MVPARIINLWLSHDPYTHHHDCSCIPFRILGAHRAFFPYGDAAYPSSAAGFGGRILVPQHAKHASRYFRCVRHFGSARIDAGHVRLRELLILLDILQAELLGFLVIRIKLGIPAPGDGGAQRLLGIFG